MERPSKAPRHRRQLGLALCVMCVGWGAQADDFVFDTPGVIVTNDGNIVDGDDTLTVTGAGSIIVGGIQQHAIATTLDRNSVVNSGVLDAGGSGADGIHLLGATNIALNRNIIQTMGLWVWACGRSAIMPISPMTALS